VLARGSIDLVQHNLVHQTDNIRITFLKYFFYCVEKCVIHITNIMCVFIYIYEASRYIIQYVGIHVT